MACHLIGWCALQPEAQAAWAQAIMSVLAIVVAVVFSTSQERRQRRMQIDTYVEMLSWAESEAESVIRFLRHADGKKISSNETSNWTRLLAAFNAIPFHDVPDSKLFSILLDATRSCERIKVMYEDELLANGKNVDNLSIGLISTEWHVLKQCYEDAADVSNKLAGMNLVGNLRWTWRKLKYLYFKVWNERRK